MVSTVIGLAARDISAGVVLWSAVWAQVGLLCGFPCARLARIVVTVPIPRGMVTAAPVVATGSAFAALAWRLGAGFALWPYSFLAVVLVLLAVVDLVEQRLPAVVIWPSCLVLLCAFVAESVVEMRYDALWLSLAAMAILGGGHLVLALVVGGLGAGDVKLAVLLGLALGWSGWSALLTGAFLGWLFAAMVRVALRAGGRLGRGSSMPIGPYLALGALVALSVSVPIGQ